ncbi:hypothetical protein K437DRAFT_103813 [Tilletiaria anomala UBC 951]|uniref:Uncharacterized protein n=1 Tax=Tilletiaria anomala (strain ATCC 24038 / CBS 436.72 / UBC 951) TaxID=1037660 RepID=A0A066W6S3_TILAU|nr:uncharacterized protein K437DRAFT_103813 [Tilletiaria anomala UBC 951]KDN46774.1 hypothetical protein K437DRAFT_103813 [Tilletiaria anomala UBC 951]
MPPSRCYHQHHYRKRLVRPSCEQGSVLDYFTDAHSIRHDIHRSPVEAQLGYADVFREQTHSRPSWRDSPLAWNWSGRTTVVLCRSSRPSSLDSIKVTFNRTECSSSLVFIGSLQISVLCDAREVKACNALRRRCFGYGIQCRRRALQRCTQTTFRLLPS